MRNREHGLREGPTSGGKGGKIFNTRNEQLGKYGAIIKNILMLLKKGILLDFLFSFSNSTHIRERKREKCEALKLFKFFLHCGVDSRTETLGLSFFTQILDPNSVTCEDVLNFYLYVKNYPLRLTS